MRFIRDYNFLFSVSPPKVYGRQDRMRDSIILSEAKKHDFVRSAQTTSTHTSSLESTIQPSHIAIFCIMSVNEVSSIPFTSSRSPGWSLLSQTKDSRLVASDTEDCSTSSSSTDLTAARRVQFDLRKTIYYSTESSKSELRKHWYDPKALARFRDDTLVSAVKLALCKSRRSWMLKRISKNDLLIPLVQEYKNCASLKNEQELSVINSNSAASPVDRTKLKALYANYEHFSGLERILFRATRGQPSKNVALIRKYAQMKCALGASREMAFLKMSRAASRSSRLLARELAVAHAAATHEML